MCGYCRAVEVRSAAHMDESGTIRTSQEHYFCDCAKLPRGTFPRMCEEWVEKYKTMEGGAE